MEMKHFKVQLSLLALLNCATMWGNDGDTFVAKSSEGIDMTFVVVSEAEKTCKVGTGIEEKAAIDQDQRGTLTIPESANGYTVVAIGEYAFYECRIMDEYHLPNSIKTIEKSAFQYNMDMKNINIPESLETIGANAFWDCQELVHIDLPEGLKTIGEDAFLDCLSLTSIVLPASLEFIDWSAFNYTPLATVTVRSSTPIPHSDVSWKTIFSNEVYQRTALYVPQGTKDVFKADSEWGRFRIIKEGKPVENPTDIAYPEDFDRQYIVYGEPVTVNINFVNKRSNPVSTISYIPTIDGVEGEERTYEFPDPIAANGEPFTLPITLPDFDEPKAADVLIDITKINGEVVDYGADIRTNTGGSAAVFAPVPNHKVLIMDFTSPTCPWALRSNIGFEKVKEKYGDKVIRASFHLTGPMECIPVDGYIPFTPTCEIDGIIVSKSNYHHYYGYYDPYYGDKEYPLGILDSVEEYLTQPHVGNMKIISAQWADEDQTAIKIVTEATLGMSDYERSYMVEYIVVEDGLTGDGTEWEQQNGYSGQTTDDPNLQPLTQLPSVVTDMVYNDVAVKSDKNYYERYLQPFSYGEPQKTTFTIELSKKAQNRIQDKGKLSVVALLKDDKCQTKYGTNHRVIIDSDKKPLSFLIPGDVTGSGSVNVLDVVTTISYILGQKPATFFEEAADVNGDGKVDITDVTELIEKLKSKSGL